MVQRVPVAMTMLVLATIAGAAVWASTRPSVPACALLLGKDRTAAAAFAECAAETPVRLAIRHDAPLHVWVASWSETDGTLALFPSPWLRTDACNPLPAGERVLPGRDGERDLAWTQRPVPGVTHYLIAASLEPQPDLAGTFARLRQASNTTFPDGSMVITAPKEHSLSDVPPRQKIADPLLQRAADEVGQSGMTAMRPVPDRPGLWVASFQVVPPPAK